MPKQPTRSLVLLGLLVALVIATFVAMYFLAVPQDTPLPWNDAALRHGRAVNIMVTDDGMQIVVMDDEAEVPAGTGSGGPTLISGCGIQ